MRASITTSLFTALLLGFSVSALAQDSVALRVNGVPIPQAHIDFIVAQLKERGTPDSPELRAKIREDLIIKNLLLQEANKTAVSQDPAVQTELALSQQNIVLKGFVRDYQKTNPITDEKLQNEYERIKSTLQRTQYLARHILLKTEKEAQAVLAALKQGKKFESLAKQSADPGSKDKGGELGWAAAGDFVPEFAQALLALKKGQTTTAPVQTQYGFHIIRVDDTRNLPPPSLETIKDELRQELEALQLDQFVKSLRARAVVQ
ncbi:peptidylprolyl isomerase [Parvibium lacunae]|uniref:peptidylprolyl isomerase n=1 Tax=Parvibium lacunae TaxID=1888893 RepID=A0A368L0I7_9BURK|nr:peptidylprolyl isomerase [Parvibium lacunae]RCS57080.1 peptidylprolyl isomerase [Parvibium lacunae]